MSDPRYPIGKFSYTDPLTAEQKQQYLTDIEQTPAWLRAALRGLLDHQLDTPYRDGGWTPRQVAHHVADSHMNFEDLPGDAERLGIRDLPPHAGEPAR